MDANTSYAERRKQALRDEILEAAFVVFAERGYHDAGVADIAARVGIGNSTFYRQFESKREILEQVIKSVMKKSMAALAAENAPAAAHTLDEYRAQVERIAAALDEIFSDLRVARMLLIQSMDVDTELEARVLRLMRNSTTLTAAYLEHGVAQGYLRTGLDTTATARAVVGLIMGGAYLGLDPELDRDSRRQTIQAAVELMFNGVSRH